MPNWRCCRRSADDKNAVYTQKEHGQRTTPVGGAPANGTMGRHRAGLFAKPAKCCKSESNHLLWHWTPVPEKSSGSMHTATSIRRRISNSQTGRVHAGPAVASFSVAATRHSAQESCDLGSLRRELPRIPRSLPCRIPLCTTAKLLGSGDFSYAPCGLEEL